MSTVSNKDSSWYCSYKLAGHCFLGHVEEFKKELTREVLQMTEEVSKLQREKQNVEQKIADLFAFYAKQKQSRNEVSRN